MGVGIGIFSGVLYGMPPFSTYPSSISPDSVNLLPVCGKYGLSVPHLYSDSEITNECEQQTVHSPNNAHLQISLQLPLFWGAMLCPISKVS